jgi:gp32 DNA binding protein like
MSNFASLKRQSGNLDKLAKALESLNSSEDSSDNSSKFWKPDVDKAGNGMATIRFLPGAPADGDDALPWVKIFSHGFQGPGGWLIDNCLTTKNQQCPVCESNGQLWNSGIDANKQIARDRKRKLNYISNVYIVSDPKHPENEGKVFLFRYGKKIFDKLTEAMNPQFEDEPKFNPFDLWKGANFKLKVRKLDGYPNYDKSEFESCGVLGDFDDGELEGVWKLQHSLNDLLADKEFKSYDDLKTRLDRVLGSAPVKKTTVETIKETAPKGPTISDDDSWSDTSTLDEDDMASFFEKLNEDD